MRTKTLLLTAAVGLLGAVSSFAQVYSVNAVGYVNKSLTGTGYLLIENPLNNGDNHIKTVIPGPLPDGAYVQTWDVNGQDFNDLLQYQAGDWYTAGGDPANDTVLSVGQGFFLHIDQDPAQTTTITFIGEVAQGALSLPLYGPQLLNLVGSQVPQEASFDTLQLTSSLSAAGDNDGSYAQFWNVGAQDYFDLVQFQAGAWYTAVGDPVTPVAQVGEAFFLLVAGQNTAWNRTFSVNP